MSITHEPEKENGVFYTGYMVTKTGGESHDGYQYDNC